ncbi:MAG: acyl-CoA dehydrogenase family protein [Actinomycetota bacterium]
MLDERWPSDVAELSAGLRSLLEKACGPEVVRAAESRPDGRDPALEGKLDTFGLWELPSSAAMFAAAAWEIGRALAPIPYPETATVAAVLGIRGASYGLEGAAPFPPARTVVTDPAGDLHLVEVSEPGRRTAAGDLLAVPPMSYVSSRAGGPADADRMKRLARLLHAARMMGAAERVLESVVEYVSRRTQFGKPIGSFQAVAHRLADAAIALDGATLLVRKTAWVADAEQGGDGAPSWAFASMVWAKAVDTGRVIASVVHQAMGGYGFAVEEDAQLFSRRIRSWSMRLPSSGSDMAAFARSLLDPTRRDALAHLWQNERGMPVPRWAAETDTA